MPIGIGLPIAEEPPTAGRMDCVLGEACERELSRFSGGPGSERGVGLPEPEETMMWATVLGWVWTIAATVLALAFAAAAVLSAILAAKRKRMAFLGLGAVFLLAAAVSAVANPIANMVIFHKVAERNTNQLIASMRTQCPIGQDADAFVAHFGRPARTQDLGEREIWTYDANPWWMIGWTEIEIGVTSNKITGHWLED